MTPRPKRNLESIPVIGTLLRTAKRSRRDHAKDMAASIAYFSLFSLFPLLAGVVAAASFVIDPVEVEVRLDRLLAGNFPGSADFIRENLETLIELKGAAGVASIVALFWSASKMFGALSRGINRALRTERHHPSFLSPIRHFAMAIGVSVLLFLAVAGSMVFEVIPRIPLPQLADGALLSSLESQVASFLFVFVMLMLVYRLVPYQRPEWPEIAPAALVTASLFELGKAVFVLYIDNVTHLRAIYGTVSSFMVLLLWLYFSGRVLIFGAELIAVRRDPVPRLQAR